MTQPYGARAVGPAAVKIQRYVALCTLVVAVRGFYHSNGQRLNWCIIIFRRCPAEIGPRQIIFTAQPVAYELYVVRSQGPRAAQPIQHVGRHVLRRGPHTTLLQ